MSSRSSGDGTTLMAESVRQETSMKSLARAALLGSCWWPGSPSTTATCQRERIRPSTPTCRTILHRIRPHERLLSKGKPMSRIALPFASLLMLTFYSTPALPCPSAPRNTAYSEDFYRAQRFYMEQTHQSSVGADIPLDGVILGVQGTSRDWSKVTSGLDEATARRFVSQELSRLRAQIVAECGAVLCELGKASPTAGQISAIDAASRVCSQALLDPSAPTPPTSSAGFRLTPPTQFVFFGNDPVAQTKRIIVHLENTTPGIFSLQLDGSELPPAYRERDVCSDLPNPGDINLRPSGRVVLPFLAHRPSDQSTPKTVTIAVRDRQQQQVAASARIVLFPTLDPFTPAVRSPCGEVKTNANIICTAVNSEPFADSHSDWFKVPFENGPSMGWKGQTACKAITTTSCTTPDTRTEIFIKSLVGGQCGPNGSNTGGEGNTRPQWRSGKISVPALDTADTVLRVTARLGNEGIAAYPTSNAAPGDCTFSVIGPTTVTWQIKRDDRQQRMADLVLAPGDYDLDVDCPAVQRGCYGARQGTKAEGTQTFSLSVQFDRAPRSSGASSLAPPICSYSSDTPHSNSLPTSQTEPSPNSAGCAHCALSSAPGGSHLGVIGFILVVLSCSTRRDRTSRRT